VIAMKAVCLLTKGNPVIEQLKACHAVFIIWLTNLWHWRTGWAVRHLSKQLQSDLTFRESWQANIAMPIFDCTRGHHPTNWKIEGGGVAIAVRYMPIEQANYIADQLMKHLFNI